MELRIGAHHFRRSSNLQVTEQGTWISIAQMGPSTTLRRLFLNIFATSYCRRLYGTQIFEDTAMKISPFLPIESPQGDVFQHTGMAWSRSTVLIYSFLREHPWASSFPRREGLSLQQIGPILSRQMIFRQFF